MSRQSEYPRVNHTVYRLGKLGFRILFKLTTRRHISGQHNLPKKGPYIVVVNHMSHVDPPLVYSEFPFYSHVMVAEKYQHHLFRPIVNMAGPIFVNRGQIDRAALRQSLAVLKDGGVLSIAIEGTRSDNAQLAEGKDGVAYLANKANAPVLPIAIYGTEAVFDNLKRLRRTDVYVSAGQPIHFPPGRVRSKELSNYTDRIMVALAAMLPEKYRGFYANHPLLQEALNANSAS